MASNPVGSLVRRFTRTASVAGPVVLAVGIGLAACGADEGAGRGDASGDLAVGERVYADNCATCHGDDGEGGTGPRLGGGAVVDSYPDADDHRAIVADGLGSMPAWKGTLSDDEIDAVVAYEREVLGTSGD